MTFSLLLIASLGAFGWLSFRYFHLALPLFLALLPTYLIRFSLGPLPTTFLEMGFWILFGAWILRGRHVRRPLPTPVQAPSRPLVIILFIFTLLSLSSLLIVPREHTISSLGLWRAYFLEPFLFGWMLWETLRSERLHQNIARGVTRLQLFLSLVFSGFILALLGIIQYVFGLGIPTPWDIDRRITSVFDYPNALGLFLAPIFSALLVFGFSTWKQRLRHEKIFIGGASFFILSAIVFAQTEAALVAIPGTLFIAFLASPLSSRKEKVATTLLAMIVLMSAFAFSPVREKLLLRDLSGQVRLSQWKETVELLRDHPLAGAGIGYYPNLLRAYHQDWQYEIFQYPHTLVLNVWVELGLFGVVSGAWGFLYLTKKTWEQRNDALVLAAGAAILTMCIHGLVDVPFFKNDLAMMTVFFAVFVFTNVTNTPRERMN